MKVGDRVRTENKEGVIITPDAELIKKIEEMRPHLIGQLGRFYFVKFNNPDDGAFFGHSIYPLTTYKLYVLPKKKEQVK